jgi:hypothetical protein
MDPHETVGVYVCGDEKKTIPETENWDKNVEHFR